MRVGILGPLIVEGDDGPVDIGGARLRALLIRLAIDVGRTVDSERLADALWGDSRRLTRPMRCSRWCPGCDATR